MPKHIPPPIYSFMATSAATAHPQVALAFDSLLAALDERARETSFQLWSQWQADNISRAPAIDEDEPLTVEKTAELLDVAPQTVLVWRKRGLLVGYKLGARVYFKRSEVLMALKVQSTPDGRRKYARRQYEQRAR